MTIPSRPETPCLVRLPAPGAKRVATAVANAETARMSEPVFIVGEARSGSTLLFRALLQHPVLRPRMENLQETSIMIQVPRADGFRPDEPRNLRRFMLEDDSAWGRFLADVGALRPWLSDSDPEAVAWATRTVARSFLFHAREARGCRRLVEKTPGHVDYIEDLLEAFPRARLLYIHRHPIDVYSSYVRRARVDPKATWARLDADEFCRLMSRRVATVLTAMARNPRSIRLVNYGDFTARPVEELTRICGFLGLSPRPDILGLLADSGGWAHWERSSHLYEGIKTQTKDWGDYCTTHEASLIQDRLGHEMTLLGHLPYDDRSSSLAAAADIGRENRRVG